MADPSYDLAVLGSTPLAVLLAGLLAKIHGRRVVLCGDPPSPHRPPRSIDLSAGPITRPATWALLKDTVPETIKLVRGLGSGLYRRVEPLLVATTDDGREGLGHIRNVAAGFGIPAERYGEAVRFRDAAVLRPVALHVAAQPWLAAAGVLRCDAGGVTIRRDGRVRIDMERTSLEAARAVLCDDAAILGHLGPDGERMRPAQRIAILTEPAPSLAAPVMLHVDSGVILRQRQSGAIEAIAPDSLPPLGLPPGARYAGRAAFRTVATVDGAPLAGTIRNRIVLAGFGVTAAFLAPAIARFIAGASAEAERLWFAAHDAGKGRGAVAEFGAIA
jgi:hypothetical protein